jgi:hypothetical protein
MTATAASCGPEPKRAETTGVLGPATAEDIARAIQSVVGDDASELIGDTSDQPGHVECAVVPESLPPLEDRECGIENQPPEDERPPRDGEAGHRSGAPADESEEPVEGIQDPDVEMQQEACDMFIALHAAQKECRRACEAMETTEDTDSEVLEDPDLHTYPFLDAGELTASSRPTADEPDPWPNETGLALHIPFDSAFQEENVDI